MQSLVASWIVFVIVGAVSGFLRYGGGLSGGNLQLMMEYGKYVVMAIYVMIILAAFKDTVFQGIISLLVPFYGFYWLFMVSDAFLMRALVAGVLVGTGADFCVWFNETAQAVMLSVQKWIGSGG